MKQGIIIFLLFLGQVGVAQCDFSLKLEASPWQIMHNFEDLSQPFSLGYTTGLNFEKVIAKSSVAVLTGIEYSYAPQGNGYVDLTDEQNLLAVIYEQELNDRYIAHPHHQLSFPIMLLFYLNELRLGVGAAYSRYIFGDFNLTATDKQYADYGLRIQAGARLSKRVSFSIGYYYGLSEIVSLSAFPVSGEEGASLSGNMQQFSIGISFSILNSLTDQRYYLSSFNP